jgi:hypothetical protein
MVHSSTLHSTAASSESLTSSDFLANSESQLDADLYGLEKSRIRLIEYFVVVRLRALTPQEVDMKQQRRRESRSRKPSTIRRPHPRAKAITRKKTRAWPLSMQAKSRPYHECLFPYHPSLKGQTHEIPRSTMSPSSPRSSFDVIEHVLSFVGPPGTGMTSLGQLIARALGGCSSASLLVACATRPRYGATVRHTLSVGLVSLYRRCAGLVVWIQLYCCELFTPLSGVRRFDDNYDRRDR